MICWPFFPGSRQLWVMFNQKKRGEIIQDMFTMQTGGGGDSRIGHTGGWQESVWACSHFPSKSRCQAAPPRPPCRLPRAVALSLLRLLEAPFKGSNTCSQEDRRSSRGRFLSPELPGVGGMFCGSCARPRQPSRTRWLRKPASFPGSSLTA